MREILFRGKARDGKWRESSAVFIRGELAIMLNERPIKEVIKDKNGELVDVIFSFSAVEKHTVGQFTGLADKNGKKIFEGDIVKREYTLWHGETKKTRETQIGVVSYSNKECGFCLDKVCNLRKPWDGDTLEVIGNIHDNPELLR
jgi:uncharacterized phage protein (TIGR01671 family)